MELFTPHLPDAGTSLGIALIVSSNTPLVLLDENLTVIAASSSFCTDFSLDPEHVMGRLIFDLGKGEWNLPQLQALLRATASGNVAIDGYEFDLKRPDTKPMHLVVHAHTLDSTEGPSPFVVLAVADVTELRRAEKVNSDLIREKQTLLAELQHRIANSLQIIASVLMQSARRVQSTEAGFHLRDAHHRVMSIATLQKMLVTGPPGNVRLSPYLNDLCSTIGASMIASPDLSRIDVSVDSSETTADQSVSVGLIVTELVINALKHAYPADNVKGVITVAYGGGPAGWTLTVSNDGVGMPAPSAETKAGLGTSIVEALATQLNAVVTVNPAHPGTRVTVQHVTASTDSAPARLL